MNESYCGKVCSTCIEKQEGRCTSCLSGPGRPVAGDCEIAACARDKGHKACETCTHRIQSGCGKLMRKDDRLKRFRAQQEADAIAAEALAARAAVLAKWLKPLFWLVIPNIIASLMANDTVAGWIPALRLPGQLLQTAVTLLYGILLLCLKDCTNRYRLAGICCVITAAVDAVAIAAGSGTGALFVTIPAAVIALYGAYQEYTAHAEMLWGVDNDLGDKWQLLWKWYIGLLLGTLGAVLLMLIIPILGVIAAFAAAIGMAVVGVLKLVYLYRTMQTFAGYAAK